MPESGRKGVAMTNLRSYLAAGILPLVLMAGACGSSGGSRVQGETDPRAAISVNNTEPTAPLIPSSTNDTAGWKVVTQLFDGLVTFDAKGRQTLVQAKSITPNQDATQYTIVLRPGLRFSNGEMIKAKTYADSWSFAANAANGQLGASAFSTIEGYDRIQDEHGDPKATLSGLEVVDDLTLKVAMARPDSSFPYKVGDVAFLPLPASAYKDIKAFGNHPVGNGPYRFKSWVPNQGIELERDPSYKGPRKARNGSLEFRDYQSLDAAYADAQAGRLDVLDTVPVSRLKTFRQESALQPLVKPGPAFRSLTVPQALPHFQGREGALRRQALSRAIDRKGIADKVFAGSVVPASDFLAPTITGHAGDITGHEVVDYDPDRARELWKDADAISPWEGTLRIAYSADGTDKDWVDAVLHGYSKVLGIKADANIFPTGKEFNTAVHNRQVNSFFNSGLTSDYPHPEGYLVQGYASSQADGKGLNNGDYKSGEYDAILARAATKVDLDKSMEDYRQAQTVLFKDLPALPLWYRKVSAVAGKQVRDVPFGYMGLPVYNRITKQV